MQPQMLRQEPPQSDYGTSFPPHYLY
jgi:hypothetical protein